MANIVRLKLSRLASRMMTSHKMRLTYGDAVVEEIAKRCTEVETGARNIDHIVNATLLPGYHPLFWSRWCRGRSPGH